MPISLGGAAVLGGALSMLVYVAMAGAGEPVMQCCGAVVGPSRRLAGRCCAYRCDCCVSARCF
jgi:hypothetical protein